MKVISMIVAVLLYGLVNTQNVIDGQVDQSYGPEVKHLRPFVSNGTFKDVHGRHMVFHGVNVVYKVHPYIPDMKEFDSQASFTEEDMDNLQKWGFNLVRLGVMWEAVETAPGVYDQEYLDKIQDLVDKLGQRGIYTLIDAHQDVFARAICGEGVPNFYAREILEQHQHENHESPYCFSYYLDWFLKPIFQQFGFCPSFSDFNYTRNENADPLISECRKRPFFKYYYTTEAMTLFEALYTNKMNLQDKFIAFWDVVSKRFADNHFVVGFDALNEPLPANIYQDLFLLLPHNFDKSELTPLYERVLQTYQRNKPTNLGSEDKNVMFFEPGQIGDVLGITKRGIVNTLGFEKPPGGEIGSEQHVLNDHSYCCQLAADMCPDGKVNPDRIEECYPWHAKRVHTRAQDAKNLNVPLIITEFGTCSQDAICNQEIQFVTQVCDHNLTSWAYWEFKPFNDFTTTSNKSSQGFYFQNGTLQEEKLKLLVRPYVRAAQGTIKQISIEEKFNLTAFIVQANTDIKQATEFYLNEQYWIPNADKKVIYGVIDQETQKVLHQDVDFKYSRQADLHYIEITNEELNGKDIWFQFMYLPEADESSNHDQLADMHAFEQVVMQ